jgi:hypothetical protein
MGVFVWSDDLWRRHRGRARDAPADARVSQEIARRGACRAAKKLCTGGPFEAVDRTVLAQNARISALPIRKNGRSPTLAALVPDAAPASPVALWRHAVGQGEVAPSTVDAFFDATPNRLSPGRAS